ncbi:MAG: hypothetical protein F4X56_06260 [Gammaproteobacteria bacterium]|nr:hypothetical protein [Gammaproteobacteria bacterium]MYC25501.1 hypothetical protein [Gammaproteobacteria bacterium]
MKLSKFEELVDRHGSNLESWSDDSARDQALVLLQTSNAAQAVLRNAQSVDKLAPQALSVPIPQGLERRIMNAIANSKPLQRTWQRICTNWILKPALAVVPLALGFLIGFSQSNQSTIIEDEITTVHFEDYTEILFLAND